jgi:HSP20 family molecular chaperone IbpA
MSSEISFKSIFHPSHVTVGAHPPGHRPSFQSFLEYLSDPYLVPSTHKDAQWPMQGHSQGDSHIKVSSPNFDIRETDDAYYLEGEFPGVRDQNAIFIERLGSRALLIEARATKLDLKQEWGVEADEGSDATASVKQAVAAVGPAVNSDTVGAGDSSSSRHKNVEAPKHPTRPEEASPNDVWGKEGKFDSDSKKPSNVRLLLSERHSGSLQRSFTFPDLINFSKLKARLRDGLLRVRVPKAEGSVSRNERFAVEVVENQ